MANSTNIPRSLLTGHVSLDPVAELAVATVRNSFVDRSIAYDFLWSYYVNSAYDKLDSTWQALRARNRYYRWTRPIFNPTRRLVDFYAGQVWPGVLTAQPEDLPSNAQVAVPLPESVSTELRQAMDQIWQWSNFSSQRYSLVRYGAALGNIFVEIIDDVDRGKVVFDLIWPGHVKYLLLDYGGHVKEYVIEFDYEDIDLGKQAKFTRWVTRETIRTFRDGEPFGFNGAPAQYANPYGFAPAVWVHHVNVGAMFGMPAVRNVTKIDELNSLVSHVNDTLHKTLAAPIILAMHSPDAPLPESKAEAVEFGSEKERDSIDYIEANTGASVHTIALPQGEALQHVEVLLQEVERDHPELSMWSSMRSMSQVTGAAVERLFGDAASHIREAQGNYDTALIRLMQMSIAIAGMRANERRGAWRDLSYQQEKFTPFGLDSYNQGDLDFYILPRPVVPLTQNEAMQLRILKAQADRLENELAGNPEDTFNLPNAVYGRLARLGMGPGTNADGSATGRNDSGVISPNTQQQQSRAIESERRG